MLSSQRLLFSFFKISILLFLGMMLYSCQQLAREFVTSQNATSDSNLIFSKDSLTVDYIGTAHFETEDAGELYKQAIVASIKGDFPRAETNLKAALKLEPENYSLLAGLGNTYASENLLDEAIESYNKANTVSDSLNPGALLGLSKVYAAQGKFHKALAAIEYVVECGTNEDYISQVMTYHQLTGAKVALADCAGAERAFRTYETLTKDDDRFNALKRDLMEFLVTCAGNELREQYEDPETGELLASAETLFLAPELKEKQWVISVSLFPSEAAGNEMMLTKEFFRNHLYTDFYNNSEITASGITVKLDNTLYALADLTSTKGRNTARISYKFEIEDGIASPEILKVSYSHPEENNTVPNQISSP